MKRILLITENLGSGGAERQICGLASFLTQTGYDCRLVTYVKNQFYEPYLHQNNVDYEFSPSLRNKYLRVFRVAKYVRKYNPDIVISYLPSVNMAMCLAKIFYNSKLIVSERNNNTAISLKDRVLFNLYRLADVIVPNSNSQANFILRNFVFLSNKVKPIINFVDLTRFSPVLDKRINHPLHIVTVARYTHQKNVLKFLEVVRIVKDLGLNVKFDWYGNKEYDGSYFSRIQEKYNELNISDYLTLHSASSKIEEVYSNSDVLCLPSLFEGYPNVIIEAMSCGLPVICSDVFENPYIVKDGVNGFLFDPGNTEDMVSAIMKILSLTPNEFKKMSLSNRELCLERNTKEVFSEEYIKIIESL